MTEEQVNTEPAPGQLPMFDDEALGVAGTEPVTPPYEIMPKMEAAARNVTPQEMAFAVRVAPDLQPLVKPLADFTPHPHNLRKHNLDAIAAAMAQFGQQTPLVVQRSSGYVCKGNGTYKAAQLLGATHLAVSVEEFDDDTAFRYLLADNRTSDLAAYDRKATLEALQLLMDASPQGLQGTLWTMDDVDDLKSEFGQIVITEPETHAEYAVGEEALAEREASSKAPGQKMKEVPVVLTVADYNRFMANVVLLRKEYGTAGTIATVVEAVRREAQLFGGAQVTESGVVASATGEIIQDAEPEATEEELLARLAV